MGAVYRRGRQEFGLSYDATDSPRYQFVGISAYRTTDRTTGGTVRRNADRTTLRRNTDRTTLLRRTTQYSTVQYELSPLVVREHSRRLACILTYNTLPPSARTVYCTDL